MDKIEERAQKFMDDNNYVITVLSDDKENDDTWMHNENTVLADFAKQEREAVRAEIGIILNIFNEKNVKGVRYKDLLKSVIGNLQILSESLKGDE